jgi:CRP-like cAMP-binding protein
MQNITVSLEESLLCAKAIFNIKRQSPGELGARNQPAAVQARQICLMAGPCGSCGARISFGRAASNRLARLISRLPAEQLEEQRITQDQLAAQLGTVREVVARSLRDLERSGAIRVERRQIRVLNEHLLRDWAQEPTH